MEGQRTVDAKTICVKENVEEANSYPSIRRRNVKDCVSGLTYIRKANYPQYFKLKTRGLRWF